MSSIRLGFLLAGLLVGGSSIASDWTAPQSPFRVHGGTYYVGSRGLTALLITSDAGHVLIDVPLEENVAMIEANIRALGFRVEDVKMILNSHPHHDHAGGMASMAQRSGADVHASTASALALRAGGDDAEDPQHGSAAKFAAVAKVKRFEDGAMLRLGDIELTAHLTPGHTPGSTTWTWSSCEKGRCVSMVYADSLTAMVAGKYRYSDPAHPERVVDFRAGLKSVAALDCDVLITPHPDASGFLDRVARRDSGDLQALVDRDACRVYARSAAKRLDAQLAKESGSAAE